MADFRYGCGTGPDADAAAAACLRELGPGGTIGFLYVSDRLSDHLADMLLRFRLETGVEHWVGTVGIGVCATDREYMDQPAVVAMTGDFPPDAFKVFGGVADSRATDALDLQCGDSRAAFAIVHADPHNVDIEALITACAAKVESGFLMGGLASSRGRSVHIADAIHEDGLSGVAFSDSVAVATRLTQGCTPIASKHTITAAQRNVVMTLDDRPALDVLKEDIGEQTTQELSRVGGTIFAGLPVAGSDTGDYVARHLIGIDPVNGLIAIGDMVQPGGQLLFCRRDRETARQDMTRMLKSIKQGLYGQPRGGLYFSCLGRGPGLFGEEHGELAMIREALGDFPLVGFFCNGEISHNRLYGYTGVLTLFV
ncbi:MAG: FIST C-terminal domain-containing protein [Rhodospirillaceae bacterium]